MEHPSRMSLPSAATLPVSKLKFSKAAKARRLTLGIVSALQLAEIASRNPLKLQEITEVVPTNRSRDDDGNSRSGRWANGPNKGDA